MTAKTDISKCLSLLFGKLKLCIFLSFIVLCLVLPTANYDLAIIEDYLAGNAKIKISIKKQNGVVVIFGEPWQLLLTGSAVPRIINNNTCVLCSILFKRNQLGLCLFRKECHLTVIYSMQETIVIYGHRLVEICLRGF